MTDLSTLPQGVSAARNASDASPYDLAAMVAARENERFSLHTRYLNEMWVRVLKTIGYDVGFTRGDRKSVV